MQRGRRGTTTCLLLACLLGLAACGGTGQGPTVTHPLQYRPGVPLHLEVARTSDQGPVRVQQLTYTSVDGQRVPALFSTPIAASPLGCLIYQGGLGQTKEDPLSVQVRQGAAALRLATFTIDPRDGGARGSVKQMEAALKTPESLLAMVLGTVADLRVGLDYLESRPGCHHNIAYMGTSFGGVVGAILAGQDPRVKATILTSIGATFEQAMLVGGQQAKNIKDLPVQVPGAATDPAILAHAVKVLGPYDPETWVAKISPRALMLINGRFDPLVPPIDALQLAAAAGSPTTVLYFNGGHNPFAPGPGARTVTVQVGQFLVNSLGLPAPA